MVKGERRLALSSFQLVRMDSAPKYGSLAAWSILRNLSSLILSLSISSTNRRVVVSSLRMFSILVILWVSVKALSF